MTAHGLYVYGLVRAAQAPELGRMGLRHLGAPGCVYAVRAQGMAALVSDCDVRRRIAPLRCNLEPHDRVIREALKTTTIIPMTFGHVARNEREVDRTLRRHARAIGDELDRLEGMVEMSVRVKWDVDDIFKYVVDADPLIATVRDRIFDPVHPPTYTEKLELGRMFEERLDAERADLTARLLASLATCAREVEVGRARGHTTVAELSFLVSREGVATFEQRVRDVAAGWPSAYVFQSSGPLAPFDFVQLRLTGADAESRGFDGDA